MDGADCSIFRRGRRRPAGKCPGRERPLIRKFGGFLGVERARRVRAGDYPPRTFPARQGRFSRGSRGAGSPPSASAWPAPRSPESARGANSPNALARAPSGQPRTGRQKKRFQRAAAPNSLIPLHTRPLAARQARGDLPAQQWRGITLIPKNQKIPGRRRRDQARRNQTQSDIMRR